ncbi:MAG: FtsH protease modulator YccA [Ewingella americana]|jgi:modulator of FtsH protease|uniref:Modulator of FtsH protease YccA n=2 Tax=Ewingella americana TaxID=41202 RepID=A0A2N0N215_9GAMM|nr:FtsH protease modulator YccA [Ewingella americana]NWA44324.1 FtsH protease modulator YccA [Pseudomonas reactans]KAA8729229.1 FtsH protease modulator YccA [Ewingella americana]KFC83905.1 putative TEGT family carrier/transport protein [Ewingella americana ATCC 33852]MCI1677163.1 FtsH protease modulator YccA [Ewingella americana]MCI1853247.1 FtsH protease modulator YccA [Ewingella americana]
MERIVASSSSRAGALLSTHRVLRNTYFLLALTLGVSAITATASTLLRLPSPGMLLTLVGFYGLMFLTYRTADRPVGILAAFALTGFMGYTLGPLLSSLLSVGAGDIIMLALGGTALVFFCCSAYVLTTRKDMSFLSGMMMAGFVVLLVAVIANLFLQIPALSLAISCLFILFSAGAILWETSNIIHGGETNYIRATVSLYVSLYNVFVSLLSILGLSRSN